MFASPPLSVRRPVPKRGAGHRDQDRNETREACQGDRRRCARRRGFAGLSSCTFVVVHVGRCSQSSGEISPDAATEAGGAARQAARDSAGSPDGREDALPSLSARRKRIPSGMPGSTLRRVIHSTRHDKGVQVVDTMNECIERQVIVILVVGRTVCRHGRTGLITQPRHRVYDSAPVSFAILIMRERTGSSLWTASLRDRGGGLVTTSMPLKRPRFTRERGASSSPNGLSNMK